MRPKIAVIILIILLLITSIFFAVLYFNKNISDKQNNFLPSAEKSESAVIRQKIIEKHEYINKNAKDRPYTQDEINFILNPEKTIKEELGIQNEDEQPQTTKLLSQDEIDLILGAKK